MSWGRVTTRNDPAIAASIIKGALDFVPSPPFVGIVIERDGVAIGAVILNGYECGRNIWVTWASSGALSRRVFKDLADYIFRQLDCARCSALTRASNTRARRALSIVGFREEGVMRDHFGDEDGVLYGLTRREQKLALEG